MATQNDCIHDVMQVCRNGHVIHDLLLSCPEHALGRCDRCGAETLEACPTCGAPFPGKTVVAGLVPVGRAKAPSFCFVCGSRLPWARIAEESCTAKIAALVTFLRRMPRVIFQLHYRHAERPPFHVRDQHDLEDLLRAILPLQFDCVFLQNRTPKYARANQTDFLLDDAGTQLALTAKMVGSSLDQHEIGRQIQEDVEFYAKTSKCAALVVFIDDREQRLWGPEKWEAAWARLGETVPIHPVIAR